MLQRLFNGGNGAAKVPSINPREAWERLSTTTPQPALIDVREPWEYAGGHAKGAKNIPLGQLSGRLNEIPKDRQTLLICQSGSRSMNAANFLSQQGFSDVVNITGGTTVWQMHKLPTEGSRR